MLIVVSVATFVCVAQQQIFKQNDQQVTDFTKLPWPYVWKYNWKRNETLIEHLIEQLANVILSA